MAPAPKLTVEMTGPTYELKDHRIPLERTRERGWGKVSIPADANPADNDFWFVFEQPQPRRTLVVGDDPQASPAAAAGRVDLPRPGDPVLRGSRRTRATGDRRLGRHRAPGLAGPLARRGRGQAVQAFVDRGGQVVFLPPRTPGDAAVHGRPLADLGRRASGRFPSRAGAAIRTCWPTRRAAPPCRSGDCRSASPAA